MAIAPSPSELNLLQCHCSSDNAIATQHKAIAADTKPLRVDTLALQLSQSLGLSYLDAESPLSPERLKRLSEGSPQSH